MVVSAAPAWRWCLCPELRQAGGCASINTIPASTQLCRTSGGIGWKTSHRTTTPSTVCLCSVIYSALSSGNPRAPGLLRRTPGCCYNPAQPRSSSASSPSCVTHVPFASTRCRVTRTKGDFVSTGGIPNPLWLLHRSLGCASQGNVGT